MRVARCNRIKDEKTGMWMYVLEIIDAKGYGTGSFVFIHSPSDDAFKTGQIVEMHIN